MTRCIHHAMTWLGAEFAISTVADRLMPLGATIGAIQVGTTAVPFPDERYQTVASSFRRTQSYELSTPANQQALRQEAEQLSRGPMTSGAGVVNDDSTAMRSRRALVLDVRERSQREVLRVLREDPALQVIDRFQEQRDQLSEIKPAVPQPLLDEGQRWVYYPWRRAVVRLLGPRAFSTLRLDRNHNKLTREEQVRLRTLSIGVVGVSAGHSIAHMLATEGLAGELRLADFDTIELTNLNRIPGERPRPRCQQGGRRRAAHRGDRPVPSASLSNQTASRTTTSGVSSTDSTSSSKSATRSTSSSSCAKRRSCVAYPSSWRPATEAFSTSSVSTSIPICRSSTVFSATWTRRSWRGSRPRRRAPSCCASSARATCPREVRRRCSNSAKPSLAGRSSASEVTLGAVTAAAAVRRFGLSGDLPSGRVRFDVEQILDGLSPVDASTEAEDQLREPPPEDPAPDEC